MLKAKKSLGQNFLNSTKIVDEIVRLSGIDSEDVVLEIGPGKGILTESLLRTAKQVLAVEMDGELIEFLKEKFAEEIEDGKLILIDSDILSFDVTRHSLQKTGYKVIANIPYYLTGKLFKKFLENPPAGGQPSSLTFMIQKEVGERILGGSLKQKRAGSFFKESILSLSVKVYGEPKIVKNVSAKHFIPQPKVDSVVLKIDNISRKFFETLCSSSEIEQREKKFFGLLKRGFASKRKMLKNNLQLTAGELTKCNISEKARAENLSLENWKCLYKKFTKTL